MISREVEPSLADIPPLAPTRPALLTAINATGHVHLIVGISSLTHSRCTKSVEVGAQVKLIAPRSQASTHGIDLMREAGQVDWLEREFEDSDLTSLGRVEVDNVVDAVFVTGEANSLIGKHISQLCRRLRIPVNVADSPALCTFTTLSTHTSGPLQIGVTTNGRGCHLASRIRREVAATLPTDIGPAIERLGHVRKTLHRETHRRASLLAGGKPGVQELEDAKSRRIKWLSQICEHWPLRRLAAITDADVDALLDAYDDASEFREDTIARTERGTIILAGSGPGHPSLLTIATLRAIQSADIVLADKLVPAAVIDLIPRRTKVEIARKFPGNAAAAQEELYAIAHANLKLGKSVLRLKQGDPFLYGRGAEEVAWFREKGYEAVVLPGVTSSLSGPLFAGIPVTHRAVAHGVTICTGTERGGVSTQAPSFAPQHTFVWLMALHRLPALVQELVVGQDVAIAKELHANGNAMGKDFVKWPMETPCAIIERASSVDQRIIRTTLQHVVEAFEVQKSRPPGLLVVGHACEVLHKSNEKVSNWVVEEGLGEFGRWSQEVANNALHMGPILEQDHVDDLAHAKRIDVEVTSTTI